MIFKCLHILGAFFFAAAGLQVDQISYVTVVEKPL